MAWCVLRARNRDFAYNHLFFLRMNVLLITRAKHGECGLQIALNSFKLIRNIGQSYPLSANKPPALHIKITMRVRVYHESTGLHENTNKHTRKIK